MTFECLSVEKLYVKDEKLKSEDVKIVQEWLKKQPHLPELKDGQVAVFLHSCYYRIEPTKITIDKYFTMRTHHPDLFDPLTEQALRETVSLAPIQVLPKKTSKNYVITLLKLADYNPEKYQFCNTLTLIDMVGTLYMHDKGFERGVLAVFDCKGFTLAHLTRINLSALKNALTFLQEGAPVRIMGVHFINMVPILDKAVAMAKPFIKSELIHLLKFHSSLNSFFEEVPKECMPEDYGGCLPSLQTLTDESLRNMLENYDFYKWHASQKVDENKRVAKSGCSNYGVEGTFKKLQLD